MREAGYVYVLENESMPGVFKVGFTTRDLDGRVRQLSNTSVPTPFTVVEAVFAPDARALESAMHAGFDAFRVSVGREFFKAERQEIIQALLSLHREQVEEWLDNFLPDHTAALFEMIVDDAHINCLARDLDRHPFEVAAALNEVTCDELRPALGRMASRSLRLRVVE
jgi:hypothetical protein